MHIVHIRLLNSLDEKYSKSVIFWLYDKEQVLKTDLQSVVKNLYSLNSLLERLEEDKIIKIEKKPFGKNITEIKLTQKGRKVAEQLKRADLLAQGKEESPLDMPHSNPFFIRTHLGTFLFILKIA